MATAPAHLQIAFAQATGLPYLAPTKHMVECETCHGEGAYADRDGCDTDCEDCGQCGQVLVDEGTFESAADNADFLRRVVKRRVSNGWSYRMTADDCGDILYAAHHLEAQQRELADALGRVRALTAQLEHQTAERVRAEAELSETKLAPEALEERTAQDLTAARELVEQTETENARLRGEHAA